jgi:3-hydroxypropanoate dehydrogenase
LLRLFDLFNTGRIFPVAYASPLPDGALDTLFRTARTHTRWLPGEVSDDLLHKVHELAKFGPTSANCCPLRIVYIKSQAAKARLKPLLDAGNVDKTMAAPVTALFAYDLEFYEKLSKLFPHTDARSWFVGRDAAIRETAVRNGTLQAAYYMLAARALGLDCGPMSGFNREKATAEFFAGTKIEANFLCNIGHGDAAALHPRSPRLDFDEMSEIL